MKVANVIFAFDYGEEVYIKTDYDQLKRVITGYYMPPGQILYEVTCRTSVSRHYGFELSAERDPLITTSN